MSDFLEASAGAAQRPPTRETPVRLEPPRSLARALGPDDPRPRFGASEDMDLPPSRTSAHLAAEDEEPRRLRCLLTTLSPERALSRALVQHLTAEMPGIEFRLRLPAGAAEPDALWICGYRPGHADLVAALRRRHPSAALVVTGRGPIETWAREVTRAGADTVCTWPLPYARLAEILRRGGATSARRGRALDS